MGAGGHLLDEFADGFFDLIEGLAIIGVHKQFPIADFNRHARALGRLGVRRFFVAVASGVRSRGDGGFRQLHGSKSAWFTDRNLMVIIRKPDAFRADRIA